MKPRAHRQSVICSAFRSSFFLNNLISCISCILLMMWLIINQSVNSQSEVSCHPCRYQRALFKLRVEQECVIFIMHLGWSIVTDCSGLLLRLTTLSDVSKVNFFRLPTKFDLAANSLCFSYVFSAMFFYWYSQHPGVFYSFPSP